MKKILHFLIILIFISCQTTEVVQKKDSIHIIILNDGSEYKGRLIKIEGDKLFFLINNKINEFNRDDIKKIQFKQERLFEEFSNINQIKDPDIKFIWEKARNITSQNNENIAILLYKKNIVIDENNNYKMNIKIGFKVLTEEGKQESTQYFYYNKLFSKARLLYGITISKNGRLSFVEEEAINDEPIYNINPQYDIVQRIKFGLKDSEIGAVHIWEAEITGSYDDIKNPFFLEENLIEDYYLEKKVINIIYPENKEIEYEIYNGLIPFKKPDIRFSKSNKFKQISFTLEKIETFINDEQNTPDDDKILPSVSLFFKNSLNNLINSYYKKYFLSQLPDNIKDFGNNIIGKEKDKEKIVKLLYEYINRKINYSNISPRNSRYIPLPEEKILQVNSLNALDKSYLFTRLCKNYNIPVEMLFYRYSTKKNFENFVNLKQFDSVLCIVNINGRTQIVIFEKPDFTLYQRNLESSDAIGIIVSSQNYSIVKLDKISLEENVIEQHYICELNENNSLKVKRISIIKGSEELSFRNLRGLTKEEIDKNIISRLNSISDDIELINYKFINELSDFDKNIYLEENFIINNFSITSGSIKLFNLPGFNYTTNNVIKETRRLPFVINYIGKTKIYIEIKIPDNYKVSFVPASISTIFDDIELKTNFSYDSNILKFNYEMLYKNLEIETKNYKDIKKCLEQRAFLSKEWIMIEKK